MAHTGAEKRCGEDGSLDFRRSARRLVGVANGV
jgi:hypothetical protein